MDQLLSRLNTYPHLILTCKASPFYKWKQIGGDGNSTVQVLCCNASGPLLFLLLSLETWTHGLCQCCLGSPPTTKDNNLGRELVSGNSACRVLGTCIGLCDCLLFVPWVLAGFESATGVQVPNSWVWVPAHGFESQSVVNGFSKAAPRVIKSHASGATPLVRLQYFRSSLLFHTHAQSNK